jgi:hypothetical protein
MAEEQAKNPENGHSDSQQEVVFRYFKSRFFRVVHADGAWGGLSPRGDIHISFYNERAAIPDTSKIALSKTTGQLVKPEEFEASSEFVREIEVDVIVDLLTAMQLRTWLDDKIKGLQSLIAQAQQEKTG